MTKFTVNNQPVQYRMNPQTPLLWALRDASNLTGTKYGCGTGHCGACIVDIDGVAKMACMVPIGSIEGSFVTTIEGLSHDRSHPIQAAFLAENVSQCGYCMPGLVMAAAVFLRANPRPSEDQIRAGITNICRCGVYPRLVEAIQRAGRIQRGDETVASPRPGIDPTDASRVVPALTPPGK
ncbi:MAG: (2Fe-2S)-binding protein [Pseudomonadota bacterium]